VEKKKIRITEIKYYIGSKMTEKVECNMIVEKDRIADFKLLMRKDGQIIYLTYIDI